MERLFKVWKYNLERLFKNPDFPISFINWEKLGNIHSPRPTIQNSNVEFMVSWEDLCPSFSFTVENKMGNSHKRGR